MKKTLFLTLMLGSIGVAASAQRSFEARFGTSLPTGKFASTVKGFEEGSGNAAAGIAFGATAFFPLQREGLSLTAGIDVFVNEWKEEYKKSLGTGIGKYSKYVNVPLMAGAQYSSPAGEGFAVFGTVGIGLNVFKITDISHYDKIDGYTSVGKVSPSVKPAYRLGGGAVFKDRFTLAAQYYGLGSHKPKFTVDDYSDSFETALSVSALTLTLGIRF